MNSCAVALWIKLKLLTHIDLVIPKLSSVPSCICIELSRMSPSFSNLAAESMDRARFVVLSAPCNKITHFILYFTVKTNVYQNLIKLVFSLT